MLFPKNQKQTDQQKKSEQEEQIVCKRCGLTGHSISVCTRAPKAGEPPKR